MPRRVVIKVFSLPIGDFSAEALDLAAKVLALIVLRFASATLPPLLGDNLRKERHVRTSAYGIWCTIVPEALFIAMVVGVECSVWVRACDMCIVREYV
jgi:hypothetical protein